MARLPARSSGRNRTLIDPSREIEDIYDRMGQLVNVALRDREVTVTGEATDQVKGRRHRSSRRSWPTGC
jgi:hypothetical protein